MAKENYNLRAKVSVTRGVHVEPSKAEKNVEPIENDSRKVQDPLEGFDVESGSEKDFLEYCLENDAPKLDIELFENARRSPTTDYACLMQQWRTDMTQEEWDDTVAAAKCSGPDWQEFKFLENATTEEIDGRIYELLMDEKNENGQSPMAYHKNIAPFLVLQKRVKEFVNSHRFSTNNHATHTTLQRRQFERDIYDYARALGMSKRQAELEVKRAKAVHRSRRGLPGGFKLDETDDESTLGLEINDTVEYVRVTRDMVVQGTVDPAEAWTELTSLPMKCNSAPASSKKRKLDMKEEDDDKPPACLNMNDDTDNFHSTMLTVNDDAQFKRLPSTKSKSKLSERQRAKKREEMQKQKRRAKKQRQERRKLESDKTHMAGVNKLDFTSRLPSKSMKMNEDNDQKVSESDQSSLSSHADVQTSPGNLISPQQPGFSNNSTTNTPRMVKRELDDSISLRRKKKKRLRRLSYTNGGFADLTSKTEDFESIRKDENNNRIRKNYVDKAPQANAFINDLTPQAQPQQKTPNTTQRIAPPISFLDKTLITGIRSDDKENAQDKDISRKTVAQNLPLLKMEVVGENIHVSRDLLHGKIARRDRGRVKRQFNQEQLKDNHS